MEHAERLCDRIVLINRGRKAFEGGVGEALALVPRIATVEVENGFDLGAALAPAFAATPEGEGRWRVALDGPEASRRLLSACVAANAPLTLYEPARATLHDAFVRIVGEASA
jgi:ABC-2 type transport system ATP-binding protein